MMVNVKKEDIYITKSGLSLKRNVLVVQCGGAEP